MATATATRTNGNGHKNGNGHGKSNGNGKSGNGSSRLPGGANGNGKPSARLSAAQIELRIQQFEKAKNAAKELYDTADRIESELIEAVGVDSSVLLGDGRTAKIVNNFIDAAGQPKVKHYGMAGVRMFSLKIK